MRTLLSVIIDTNAGNKSITNGSLPQIIQGTMEKIKPEASYFFAGDGQRTCFMVFDLKDAAEIPAIAEPLFQHLNAKVQFLPVMSAEDLHKGLQSLNN
jgi:hypothetical protein